MKALFICMVALLVMLPASHARAQSDDAVRVIRATVDQVFEVLRDPALKKPEQRQQRLAKLRTIADRAFDWEKMAQSSLGVTYRKLSDEQRKQFVTVFKDLIAQEYMDDIDRFMGDEKVMIKGTEKRDENRLVKTILITHSRERVPIDYLMYRPRDDWRIHDFSVEGISLVNHYRATFSRFLANHTFDELLARLKARLPAG